jgi:hypothetical protein
MSVPSGEADKALPEKNRFKLWYGVNEVLHDDRAYLHVVLSVFSSSWIR